MNSLSYWLSLAQVKTNAAFFIAFRMRSLSHNSLFHGIYRFRQLTEFGFYITDTKNQSLIGRVRCLQDKSVTCDTNAPAMLSYSYLYDKLNNVLSDDSFILSEYNLPVV